MIAYALKERKSGKIYAYSTPQLPSIEGFGNTPSQAFKDMAGKMTAELKRRMAAGEALPDFLSHEERRRLAAKQEKGTGTFCFPLTVELKLLLYNTMKAKKVTRPMLAKLLALLENEVSPDGWRLANTLTIEPKAPPKYKKVQRLLDIEHDSSINEIAEAFRVLDSQIDVRVCSL